MLDILRVIVEEPPEIAQRARRKLIEQPCECFLVSCLAPDDQKGEEEAGILRAM
ncbi:MAG: hypothetical protein ACREPM_09970 [Gemmatimonadaceae bacterium]